MSIIVEQPSMYPQSRHSNQHHNFESMSTPPSSPFKNNFCVSSSSSISTMSNISCHQAVDVLLEGQTINLYEPIQTIGGGSFGKIVRIKRKCDKAKLVWKELELNNMTSFEKKQVDTEINVLRLLSSKNHPNIVKYHDNFSDIIGKTFIVMEYCENGDLASYIESHRRNGTWIQESFIWKILGQVASALHECHRLNNTEKNSPISILHRDVKPANILLDRFHNAKLCDFGLATELYPDLSSSSSPSHLDRRNSYGGITIATKPRGCLRATKSDHDGEICGTPFYMAPERVNRCNYDDRSDIWSLGCIIYEMAALQHPFIAENESELASRINSGYLPRLPNHYSHDLHSTCEWLLRREMTRRPTAKDICHLPQLQVTLSEIRLKTMEAKLEDKRLRFEHEASHSRRKLEEKEKYLLSLESRLRDRENDIRARERRIESWEHPPQPPRSPRCHDSLHLPHLIDDPPRTSEYKSTHPKMEQYPMMYPTQSPPPCEFNFFPRTRLSYTEPEYDQPYELRPRQRKHLHSTHNNHPILLSTSPRMEPSHKRQRMDEHPTKTHFRNSISMSPKVQRPVVSYEEYCFRRSRS